MKPLKNKAHLGRIITLPCVCCGVLGVQVHHIKGGGLGGMGMKASDWFTMPLCETHHTMFHTMGIRSWEGIFNGQVGHVEATLDRLYG